MDYMDRALELAWQALGQTSPNPAVGAVIVKDGEVMGEGCTSKARSTPSARMDKASASALYRDNTFLNHDDTVILLWITFVT